MTHFQFKVFRGVGDTCMILPGTVYFVGAGPGDPGLVTLRGVSVIQKADVILYDYLVNPRLLSYAQPDTKCICLGRHGRQSLWAPEEIQSRLIKEATAGRSVVRLKSGDPMIFGRAAAELAAVAAADVPFEVVPGVTAGLAAAAYAGIAVTNRDIASAVALVTGQENPDKLDSQLDFSALAQFPGTLVIYMGVTTAKKWTEQLISHGMDPGRPVTLVRRCGWPDQGVINCRLDEVVDRVIPYRKFPPPVVAVVGAVTQTPWSWFDRRPLWGQTVIVTRPIHQAESLVSRLEELGASVILQPAVEILDPPTWREVDQALENLDAYDDLVFTSVNGVEKFMRRLMSSQQWDVRRLGKMRLSAVGPATVAALAAYHLRSDMQPVEDYRAESVLAMLKPNAAGRRFLVVRGERGRDVVAPGLRAVDAHVDEVVAYVSRDVTELKESVIEQLHERRIDWVMATSAAIGEAAVRLFAGHCDGAQWVAISPRTAKALQKGGVQVVSTAKQATVDAMIDAMLAHVEMRDH